MAAHSILSLQNSTQPSDWPPSSRTLLSCLRPSSPPPTQAEGDCPPPIPRRWSLCSPVSSQSHQHRAQPHPSPRAGSFLCHKSPLSHEPKPVQVNQASTSCSRLYFPRYKPNQPVYPPFLPRCKATLR
uniref:Uncharacterized protein n=1 Tax=Rhizophora mucronata TaxID=61149 RepID=A0A2P2PAQ8_RHIMU